MNSTVEQQVASAILQKEDQVIEVGGRKYYFGKPSVATIIEISALISRLPDVRTDIKDSDISVEVLRVAKDSKVLGEIVAMLILGAKKVKEEKGRRWWNFKRRSDFSFLSENILLELDAAELSSIIIENLTNLRLGNFFAITASLAGANAIKPTKDEAED